MYQHSRLNTNRFGFIQKFKNFDYILLVCILMLGFISLATMYSTDGGKVLFHTKSHFTKLIVFTLMMLIISFINIKFWFLIGYLSYVAVIVLLFWTYSFGVTSSGSQRWIDLYFINLQPSELMKIFIILCLAKYFHRMKLENVNSIYTILTSLIIILLPMGLVIVQPDLGTSAVILATVLGVLFLAGVHLRQFLLVLFLALIGISALIIFVPWRWERIISFTDPWSDPFGTGYQLTLSLMSIGRGDWFGVGLGEGLMKMGYLPDAHTDFIYSVIVEEMGLLGGIVVISLLFGLAFRCFYIAKQALIKNQYFLPCQLQFLKQN